MKVQLIGGLLLWFNNSIRWRWIWFVVAVSYCTLYTYVVINQCHQWPESEKSFSTTTFVFFIFCFLCLVCFSKFTSSRTLKKYYTWHKVPTSQNIRKKRAEDWTILKSLELFFILCIPSNIRIHSRATSKRIRCSFINWRCSWIYLGTDPVI